MSPCRRFHFLTSWPGPRAAAQGVAAAAELMGPVAAAGMARMVRKAALEMEVVSAEQEIALPLAARTLAHSLAAAVVSVHQNPAAPLGARPARTQARAGQRAVGEAALHQKSGLGWAHSAVLVEAMGAGSKLVTAEAAAMVARAAAGAPGAAAKGKVGCPAVEVEEAASAPPASRNRLLP